MCFGVFFALIGTIGLVLNPDFGTGSATSAEQFIVDWNGWHALLTLLLAPPAFAAATSRRWAMAFLAYNAFTSAVTAAWALFDTRPLGILDFPHASTDVVLHLAVFVISMAVLLAQVAHDRAAGGRPIAT